MNGREVFSLLLRGALRCSAEYRLRYSFPPHPQELNESFGVSRVVVHFSLLMRGALRCSAEYRLCYSFPPHPPAIANAIADSNASAALELETLDPRP